MSNIDSSMEKETKLETNETLKKPSSLKRLFIGLGITLTFVFIIFVLLTVNIFSLSWGDVKTLVSKNHVFDSDGKINILLLGKGDFDHEGSDLTDTIIFLSLNKNTKKITLVSLPRDIWIPSMRAKINSAYYWGRQKDINNPYSYLNQALNEILGENVENYAVVNFSNFENIINALGGVDVLVENSFKDEKYPIKGKENDTCNGDLQYKCRFETIEFREGFTHMDGALALKYVRSRNSEGDEGTDLARDKRQQKLIEALKNKVLSPRFLLSIGTIKNVVSVGISSMETNITRENLIFLVKDMLSPKIKLEKYVLGEDFLVNPSVNKKYDNQYVFISKEGGWNRVHNWIDDILNKP